MINQPISEQYRLAALEWVDLDSAARLLEDTKSAVLATYMKNFGDIPVAHAERDVKASSGWKQYIESLNAARTAANYAKIQVEYLRMKHAEQQSLEASKRAEMRL